MIRRNHAGEEHLLESDPREDAEGGTPELQFRKFRRILRRWSLKDGVKELLSLLRGRGKKVGLVTNVGKRAVQEALGRFGVRDFFDEVVTRNDTTFMKPRGEGIRRCLSALGVRREEAIFIGDSLSDLHAARDAGVRVAIVKGGESLPEEILKEPPDYLWDSLKEALKVLKADG